MNRAINQNFDFVDGSFNLDDCKMVCVQNKKYMSVKLCIKENMNIPIAKIKLYSGDSYADVEPVFDDAVLLCEEIAKRWNAYKEANNEN